MNQQLARQALAAHDPTFDTLPPEQQLQHCHQLALPTVHRLRRQRGFLFTPVLLFKLMLLGQWEEFRIPATIALLTFCTYLVAEVLLTRRDRKHWRYLKQRVQAQAEALHSTEGVGPLLDFAHWLTLVPLNDVVISNDIQVALERLLPRLDVLRARQLSESQRAFLRHCVENQAPTVEFVVAALLVLASAGDLQIIPTAKSLAAHSSSQRIRDAAILCLEELGQPT